MGSHVLGQRRQGVSHLVAESDAFGNLRPSEKNSTGSTDGVATAIMGLACCPNGDQTCGVHDKRGLHIVGLSIPRVLGDL